MADRGHHRRAASGPRCSTGLLRHLSGVAQRSHHRRGRGHLADVAIELCRRWASRRPTFSATATQHSSRAPSFARWTTGADDDAYYHPLMLPQGFTQVNLAPHWLASDVRAQLLRRRVPAGAAVRRWPGAEDDHHARIPGGRQLCLPPRCRQVCRLPAAALHRPNCGVRHVLADVDAGQSAASRATSAACDTQQAGRDRAAICSSTAPGLPRCCSARRSAYRSRIAATCLFCDTRPGVTGALRHAGAPMASHTISTAQAAGWIWDIGLPTRRGTGYVYSTRHTSDDEAHDTLMRYFGAAARGARAAQNPVPRRASQQPSGRTIASRWASPPAFSSRWSPRPSC